MDLYTALLLCLLVLLLAVFVSYAIGRFLKKRRVLTEVADYYRGYNGMMEVCSKHGFDSSEARFWLFQVDSEDCSQFDRGVLDAYEHCLVHHKHWRKL